MPIVKPYARLPAIHQCGTDDHKVKVRLGHVTFSADLATQPPEWPMTTEKLLTNWPSADMR